MSKARDGQNFSNLTAGLDCNIVILLSVWIVGFMVMLLVAVLGLPLFYDNLVMHGQITLTWP